jgi:hypothetical protein
MKITLTPSNPRRVKILSAILAVLIVAEIVLKLTYFH